MELRTWLRCQWDRVGAWVAIGGGLLALLLGWLGVTRTVYPAEQIPYIVSGGLLGIVLVGIGTTMWLSADLRDEWRKLDDIDQRLARMELADRAATAPPPTLQVDQPPVANGDGEGSVGNGRVGIGRRAAGRPARA
jgi:hypothetical protein